MSISSSVIANSFGFAGIAANLTWPLMQRRRWLLAGQVIACVLMLIHFALLDAHTGALIMLVAGLQASLAIPLEQSIRFKYVYLGSLSLTPIVCWVTWQGAPSLFSSLALGLVCIANFQLNTVKQRMLLILAIFAWVGHNLMIGSIPGLISNVLAFSVSSWMLLKLYRAQVATQ